MDQIIEIMARADVDYFWRDGGKHFDDFEKPIAAGVRTRMSSIVKALSAAGFAIRNSPAKAEWPNPLEAIRTVGAHAATDAIEIMMLVALLRGKHDGPITARLKESGATQAGLAVENGLIARLVTLSARAYSDPRLGDMHVAVAAELLKGDVARHVFGTGDDAARLAAFDAQRNKCRGDHRRKQVEEFRDKYTAHLGEPRAIEPATYTTVFEFGIETARTMDLLALVTKAIVKSTINDNPELTSSPAAFWAPWKT